MKNTGIFSKDKTGKLGLGLGWAQKKNNKQPVFTETNFFDKRAKNKEFQPKNIRQYVENRQWKRLMASDKSSNQNDKGLTVKQLLERAK